MLKIEPKQEVKQEVKQEEKGEAETNPEEADPVLVSSDEEFLEVLAGIGDEPDLEPGWSLVEDPPGEPLEKKLKLGPVDGETWQEIMVHCDALLF